MKARFLCFIFFFSSFSTFGAESKIVHESRALIERVLQGHFNDFILQEMPAENGLDVFEVEASPNGKIILRGNNGVSIATAFNWYLKETAHVSYDWQAINPLIIPCKLPLPVKKTHRSCLATQRFFNNTCTFGYTFAYWNWDQWQRFIDWMAMNGVNRPLMQAGQEAVWLQVWKSFGMNDEQIRSYFSAPAHLPWHRMANMDKWGGPLPLSYIDGQCKLQQQILQRSRALGMKPILSAFAGHVPEQLKTLCPNANITRIAPGWGGMDAQYTTYFLDPTDKLFGEIQRRFLAVQQKFYGTDHLYSTDPFNEITPPSWDPDYLAKVGKTIYETMSASDKDAVWYQMSWTFYFDSAHWTKPRLEAMIHAVPRGKLVFLDYVCEEEEYFRKSDNFHGAPFIWCYLGNFGGNTHLVAPLNKVIHRLEKLPYQTACVGVGSTLEGLNVNPEIYEMVLEMPWRGTEVVNTDSLVSHYAERRTGNKDKAVKDAWIMLRQKVLVDSAVAIWNHCVVFQVSPVMDLNKCFWSTNPKIAYKNSNLVSALNRMFEASAESRNSDAYQFDVVNLTRQALGNYGTVLYQTMMDAYNQRNQIEFRRYSGRFIRLGLEIDSLLATRHEFLLGKWLADARGWGTTPAEQAYYERDAREIITTWHKAGGGLTDYSNRQWNGLMRSYYLPRWIEFIHRLDDSILTGKPFDEKGFAAWSTTFEQNWVDNTPDTFQEKESGNAVQISRRLFEKYRLEMENK
ncbi:MAG: alpha-N-acetylglucosaminidase [Paludibacter sp.]|nr:alpha-N-acetylglucosaminidase [Paludibacter sp.]